MVVGATQLEEAKRRNDGPKGPAGLKRRRDSRPWRLGEASHSMSSDPFLRPPSAGNWQERRARCVSIADNEWCLATRMMGCMLAASDDALPEAFERRLAEFISARPAVLRSWPCLRAHCLSWLFVLGLGAQRGGRCVLRGCSGRWVFERRTPAICTTRRAAGGTQKVQKLPWADVDCDATCDTPGRRTSTRCPASARPPAQPPALTGGKRGAQGARKTRWTTDDRRRGCSLNSHCSPARAPALQAPAPTLPNSAPRQLHVRPRCAQLSDPRPTCR